ncbi:hypothetical protein [Yoonia sp.]|uniref:hypothetical protein n=1 Tax=Yoonia sp. TaxID=2212373 RepID=UPI002FDB6715
MKSRWQKSLEAAVAAYDSHMPFSRGEPRKAMIIRRAAKPIDLQKIRRIKPRQTEVA